MELTTGFEPVSMGFAIPWLTACLHQHGWGTRNRTQIFSLRTNNPTFRRFPNGSEGWNRTTILRFKVFCPTFRRLRNDFQSTWCPYRESNSALVLEKHLSLSLDDKGLVAVHGFAPSLNSL